MDADLSDSQRSELLAFSALAEGKLEAGTVYTTWAEPHSFSSFTQVCTLVSRFANTSHGGILAIHKGAIDPDGLPSEILDFTGRLLCPACCAHGSVLCSIFSLKCFLHIK